MLDNLVLLKRVDVWTTNALLGFYLCVAALGIVILQAIEAGRLRPLVPVAPFIPVVVQFSFGGLFSGFLSLYSRAATFALSWIFIGVVTALLLGNERFIRRYRTFSFQIGIFYTALFMFLIFAIPVALLRVGPAMFLASGMVSLVTIAILLLILRRVAPDTPRAERSAAGRAVVGVTVVIVALYFTNAVPPLPLALKNSGVYHGITRGATDYIARAEMEPWYASIVGHVTHVSSGESVYVYTAIFAPTGLTLSVVHEWQMYDAGKRAWQTVNELQFPIQGGRDLGYRGYSFMRDPTPGRYRVNILTSYGQVIGRVVFTVEKSTTTPVLTDKVL